MARTPVMAAGGIVMQRSETPLVAIVRFKDGKVAHEHIYWDQASVLAQAGLLDPAGLPVATQRLTGNRPAGDRKPDRPIPTRLTPGRGTSSPLSTAVHSRVPHTTPTRLG